MTPVSRLPKGSLILVTGANGFIATHIIKQFLQRKYKVRGTVRDLTKSIWLKDDLFAAEAANGSFELVQVEDMTSSHAYRSALHGVDGVVHIATINSWDADPNNVIPQTVAGALHILEDAAAEPSVRAFVYTSSVAAAVLPLPDNEDNPPWHVNADSWNETALSIAWAPPPYNADRVLPVYMASKVAAEQAVWKFVKERNSSNGSRPAMAVNAVLPFMVLGPLLHERQNASTAGWVLTLFNGDSSLTSMIKASIYVHVEDVALLHVAAMLDPSVENARLHAWSEPYNWNDVLAIFRKLYPQKAVLADLEDHSRLSGTVDDEQSKALLKTWGGRDGFLGLEAGITDTLQGKQPVK